MATPDLRASAAAAAVLAALAGGCFELGFDPPPLDELGPDACGNFADDDADGLADCADPGCAEACEGCMPAICVPGFARCLEGNQVVQECDASGTLFCPVGMCDPSQVCAGFSCVAPACDAGESSCTPDGRWQRCLAGTIVVQDCGPGTVCDPVAANACVPTGCTPGLFCSGPSEISECSPLGVNLGQVEVCLPSDTCLGGVCTGPCDGGLCEYFFVGLDNIDAEATASHEVFFSAGDFSAGVAVQILDGGEWTNLVSTIAPGSTTTEIMVPNRHVDGSGLAAGLAYRVTTDAPMSVRAGFGTFTWAGISASRTALWPTSRLGSDYRIVTMPDDESVEGWVGGPLPHHGGFVVVAPYDGTMVTITSSALTLPGAGIPALGPGDTYALVMNAGDVFQIESGAVGEDLTGSRVQSTLPVAVIGFHECASVEPMTCDAIAEMLPPVDRWGASYVAAVPENGGFGGNPVTRLRVVSSAPGVVVDFFGTAVTGTPPVPVALDAGGSVELELVAESTDAPGQVYVLASAPVMVAVLHGDDLGMAVLRPLTAELQATAYTSNGSTDHLMLTSLGGTVLLDGGSWLIEWQAGVMGTSAAVVHSPPLGGGFHRLDGGASSVGLGAWVWDDATSSGTAYDLGNGW